MKGNIRLHGLRVFTLSSGPHVLVTFTDLLGLGAQKALPPTDTDETIRMSLGPRKQTHLPKEREVLCVGEAFAFYF